LIHSELDASAPFPVGRKRARALMRSVPFGARVRGAGAAGEVASGYELMLSMPCWLDELLAYSLPPAVVDEIQLIEAHFLLYLQFVDDAIDGQSQIGPGDPGDVLAAAEARLAQLFPRNDPFWKDYRRLVEEQTASARWEIDQRNRPLPRFDEAVFRAIASKGALLRWPAAAMARLAGKAHARERLDDIFARFVGVALLLDDLSDVEEDARCGQVNSVLCAGRVVAWDPLDFYPAALRGAETVRRKARAELDWLARCGSTGSGFAAACTVIRHWFDDAFAAFADSCHAGAAAHVFRTLADSLR
jgi:hypothetical protein